MREALSDLGTPDGTNRHEVVGKAREYRGHVANEFDALSRTIRAGNVGSGGGNNTIRTEDGSVRYFTIREMARVQGFPDDYLFHPVWSHAVCELGNACPPPLAYMWLQKLELKRTV